MNKVMVVCMLPVIMKTQSQDHFYPVIHPVHASPLPRRPRRLGALLKYFGRGGPDVSASVGIPEPSSPPTDQQAPSPSSPPADSRAPGPSSPPADSRGTFLRSHESSPEHTTHMTTWKDLELRLQTGTTIDQAERTLLEAEKRRWRDVLTRLISIIQSLAERNLALKGSANTLHQQHNGNFLKEVELLAKFDPVVKQHIDRVESGQFSHSSYLGNVIQNELIASISGKMLDTMVTEIKRSKYYSVILDCTPNLSHQEQMSVVIRTVKMDEAPEIKEHFLGFLVASQTTGLGLSSLILNRLEELNIPFDDCRGQSYDNGDNMKGRNKGVQARLLEKNPCALYVPCGAHTLNLVVADAAKGSTDAISYFGNVQKL